MSAGTKKAYNNTFETLIAIWDVLMEYSSKENPLTVKLFVMQYADRVEVLEPQDLRDEVRDLLKKALEAYQ